MGLLNSYMGPVMLGSLAGRAAVIGETYNSAQ